jgi:hypothetical protein
VGARSLQKIDRFMRSGHSLDLPEPRSTQTAGIRSLHDGDAHCADHAGRLVFDRQADGRTKTGRAAIGTLSPRTEKLVTTYLDGLQVDLHPDAILLRTRSGGAYSRETLGHDFAAVRELTFPGDDRRLMDMRRSGVVEAVAGKADAIGLAAKLANSIGRSNTLHKILCARRHRGGQEYG